LRRVEGDAGFARALILCIHASGNIIPRARLFWHEARNR
jgi:hypothetical protein